MSAAVEYAKSAIPVTQDGPTAAARPGWRFFDRDSASLLVSFVVHLLLMLALGLTPLMVPREPQKVLITAAPAMVEEEFELPQEFAAAEMPLPDIGANSFAGAESMVSFAPELADLSELANPLDYLESDLGEIPLNKAVEITTGLHLHENLAIKGAAGEGVTGADGAIDRITQEILLSLQERKTTVIWLFDQSGSLNRQRAAIHERLHRIYEELGVIEAAGNPAFKKHDDKPLLTQAYAFGQRVQKLLPKSTDNIEEIKKAVAAIPQDDSGVERVFSAVFLAAKTSINMRTPNERTGEPERNVLVIVFTDEAGDDQDGLETTIRLCRRYAIPVYVVGVPAPFGRRETLVKWVDPDPDYDQTPQWGEVMQGPETLLPERLRLTFTGGPESEAPIDSGFGPYALTRLCYETGGIYFAVHPNRNIHRRVSRGETADFAAHLTRFFDPQVMRRYRPDYVPVDEYQRRVKVNRARAALVTAAELSWVSPMETPTLRFVKRDEAELANQLLESQKAAAKLEPQIQRLFDVLKEGEADRELETTPRWQAGYDLAMGRVLAVKVRTESFNAMLAKAKRGMKFENDKNNTWVLELANDLSVGSQLEKMAERARFYLNRVVTEHPDTPWALLAQQELRMPLGWRWKEEFTDLSPPPAAAPAANNNPPAPPQDDRARMLARPKPVRPPPKL